MNNLTLIIPAKNEKESLPFVLKEIEKLRIKCKIIIVVEKSDEQTIKAIKKFKKKVIFQTKKGYGNALITGIKNIKTKFFCIFNADGSFNPRELKHMQKIINSNRPVILFEQGAEQINNSSSETIEYLSQLNYDFYIIKKRFDFGNNLIARLLGMMLSSLFGYQLSLVKTNHFKKLQYDIILGIHKNN